MRRKLIKVSENFYQYIHDRNTYQGDLKTIASIMIVRGIPLTELQEGVVNIEIDGKPDSNFGIGGGFMY